MILGPPNFYDDGIRPAQLRYPQARPNLLIHVKPSAPPAPSAAAIATLKEVSPAHCGPTLHAILQAACMVTNVTTTEILSVRREWRIVRARHVYFWLGRALTPLSYPQIGKVCGGRDHSTVMHGCAKIARNMSKYADSIAEAKKLLGVSE